MLKAERWTACSIEVGIGLSLQAGPSLVRSGMRVADPAPMHGMQPGASLFRGVPHSEVPTPDAHERNAMIGHTLGAVDALLAALRYVHV